MTKHDEAECLIVDKVEGAEVWTLSRPQARNALSIALMQRLHDELVRVRATTDVRALILTGEGAQAFCAGADLKERADMSHAQVIAFLDSFRAVNQGFEQLPFPAIAAINGIAVGGGLELALACHFRLAVSGVKLGLPEVSLAILPGAGGTQRLAREIGFARAKEMVLLSRLIDAEQALLWGLVHRVVGDAGVLKQAAIDFAKPFIEGPALAVAAALEALRAGHATLDDGLDAERAAYLRTLSSVDRVEALSAFKEKRKPQYKGR